MKIVMGYPPLKSSKGVPQISQNRQFQWTTSGPLSYFIYPVVPAYAATLLKSNGYEVVWLDGLAEKMTYEQWEKKLLEINPDLLAIETKTPVIKYHWEIINKLKIKNEKIKISLIGDHVTALPEESLNNCNVDFIITGGDYDFGLLSIANHLSKGEKLEAGIWYRNNSKLPPSLLRSFGGTSKTQSASWRTKPQTKNYCSSGSFKLNHSLDELPTIDRDLTKWDLYAYKNSNFYRSPGVYTMFGRDCWWGRCTFCSWTTLFPGNRFRVMSVEKAVKEVENLVDNYHVKEIMDDSGSFPTGDWLRNFCHKIIEKKINKKVRINCNMRFNSDLTQKDYELMGKAGFRFILFGLESASQETLDRLRKNLKVEQIEPVLRMAKNAGLNPHITVMVGYPWENVGQVNKTISFVKDLFNKGLVDTMQATLVVPYPGTPLFNECKKNGWLKTLDWNRYDMREPVMKAKVPDDELSKAVRNLYSYSIWNRTFMVNTLKQLKSFDGWKYVSFQGLKYIGKLLEFN